jgi:hypothetical protein
VTSSRFTLEQHAEMGRTVAGLRDELLRRSIQLENAYPKTGRESRPARCLDEAREAVDQARMALETLHYEEAPRVASTSTYYPLEEDRVSFSASPESREWGGPAQRAK